MTTTMFTIYEARERFGWRGEGKAGDGGNEAAVTAARQAVANSKQRARKKETTSSASWFRACKAWGTLGCALTLRRIPSFQWDALVSLGILA